MEQSELKKLYDDFQERKFTKEELWQLDPIAEALGEYLKKHRPHVGGIVMPNRVVAYAATKLVEAWELAEWNRE